MKHTMLKCLSLVLALVTIVSVCALPAFAAPECTHSDKSKWKFIEKHEQTYCDEWGYTVYECENCYKHFAEDFVPARGRCDYTKETPVMEDATCTTPATATLTCAVCGQVKKVTGPQTKEQMQAAYGVSIKVDGALGHDWKESHDETCVKDGKKIRVCKRCGVSETIGDVVAPGHNYKPQYDTLKAPTCSTTGSMDYKCTVCGDVVSVMIKAYGHQYTVEVTAKAPTCEADGYGSATDIADGTKFHICKDCGKVAEGDNKLVPALGHPNAQCEKLVAEGSYKAATCTEDGYQWYHCNLCNKDIQVTIKAAHTKDPSTVKVTPATCDTDAVETYTCVICGKTDCTEVIENSSLQHHYNSRNGLSSIVEKFTAPTCTEYGFYWHGCTQCGLVLAPENGKVTMGGVTYDVALDGKIAPTGHQTAIKYVKDHTMENGEADTELAATRKDATCTLGEHYWVKCSCTEANWNAAAKAAVEAAAKEAADAAWAALTEAEKEGKVEADWKAEYINTWKTANAETTVTAWKTANPETNYYVAIEKEGGAPATGHPESARHYTEAQAPTCTANGWTRYFSCDACGATEIGKVTINALGHAWATRKVAATCNSKAHEETYCAREAECHQAPTIIAGSETGEFDPNNHVYELVAETLPTCTNKGTQSYRCKFHETAIYNILIPATGHSFDKADFDLAAAIKSGDATPHYPNCADKETPGYYVVRCTHTGCTATAQKGSIPYDVNNIYHHGFVDAAHLGPTVTKKCKPGTDEVIHIDKNCAIGQRGYDQYLCDETAHGCGALLALYTDDGAHNFEKNPDGSDKIYPALAATCIADGYTESKHCLDCNTYVGKVTIEKLGHKIVKLDAKASTCVVKGNTEGYTCLNCGDKGETDSSYADLVAQLASEGKTLVTYLDLVAHTWDTPAKAATCQAPGNTEGGTCTVCGEKLAITVLPQLAHSYAEYDTRTANCVVFGYKTYRCTMCKLDLYAEEYVEATGHNFSETVTAPTCTADGYTTVSCSNANCPGGFETKKDETAALGHLKQDGTTFSAQCDLLKLVPEEERYCYRPGCPNCITTETGAAKEAKKVQPVHLALTEKGRTLKTVPATCIQYAYKIDACDRCQMYNVTELSDEGYGDHNFVACTSGAGEFQAPTLTANGWRLYKCSVCKSYAANEAKTEATTDKTAAWKETIKACDVFFSMTAANALDKDVHVVNSGRIALTIKMSSASYDLYSVLMEVKYNGQYLKFAGVKGVTDVFGTDDVVAHSDNGTGTEEIVTVYAYAENTTKGEQKNVTLKGEQTFVTLYFDVRSNMIPAAADVFYTTGFDFGEVQVVSVNNGAYATVKASHDATEKAAPVKLSTVAYGNYNGYNFKKIETKVNVYRLGDITGDTRVTDVDAAALKAIILGALNDGKYVAEADVNKDGVIDAKDFVWVQRLLVGRVDYEEFCNASAN